MIKTLEEIIECNNLVQNEKQACDAWMGVKTLRHITHLTWLGGSQILLWYDKICDARYTKVPEDSVSIDAFDYKEDVKIAYADTFEDAMVDINFLKEQEENNEKTQRYNIASHMRLFAASIKNLEYWTRRKIGRDLAEDEQMQSVLADVICAMGYCKDNDDCINEDTVSEIRSIYASHRLSYDNESGIRNIVDLNHAASVQPDVEVGGRCCVLIKMDNGDKHYVYKDKNKDEYMALSELYRC